MGLARVVAFVAGPAVQRSSRPTADDGAAALIGGLWEEPPGRQPRGARVLVRRLFLRLDGAGRQKLAHVLRVVRFLVRLQDGGARECLTAHAAPERSLACANV